MLCRCMDVHTPTLVVYEVEDSTFIWGFAEFKIMVCHTYFLTHSNLVGQIYSILPMGKPMILCNDVPRIASSFLF